MNICKLSVRELVEFVYQSGHLMYTSFSIERAQLGGRIHRMLQQNDNPTYQSEIYLVHEYELDDITFIIDGRADGIFSIQDQVYIEEIKTTSIPYQEIHDENFVHFAQAYCYGFMYATKHHLDEIIIRLTYYQIETKQIRQFDQYKTLQELTDFYHDTLQEYVKWAKLKQQIQKQSVQSLQQLQFPFPSYRNGQRQFAVAVYKTIVHKETLFVQAPTGTGKTISTLFPALKAIGEQKTDKTFYLCSKNTTAKAACDTLTLLYTQQLTFKSIHLIAKDKICLQDDKNCDPNICPYANNYYHRNKEALYSLLNTTHFIQKDILQSFAIKHQVCPFELSLDASLYMDVIIADYNYVFDPKVYLKRFFQQQETNHTLLIDEAHNLVDRARTMYSTSLSQASFQNIINLLPNNQHSIYEVVSSIISYMKKLQETYPISHTALDDIDDQLLHLLDTFLTQYQTLSQNPLPKHIEEPLQNLYFEVIHFLRIYEIFDENFIFWIEHGNNMQLQIICLDPKHSINAILSKVNAAIFFSATLSPISYYKDLLGAKQDCPHLILPYCYDTSRMAIIMNTKLSTRYQHRDLSLGELIQYIYAAISAKQGNYMIFCSSYTYMQQLKDTFVTHYPSIRVHMQKANMTEYEKQEFLLLFEYRQETQVFFCVLGGSFSEGIDMKGNLVIGAIIIGVGLPMVTSLQEFMKDHFQNKNEMGHAYAYKIPGMNKVIQAAGRVIRSSSDYGMILFIDDRYTQSAYFSLLPKHLQNVCYISNPQQVFLTLKEFWKRF